MNFRPERTVFWFRFRTVTPPGLNCGAVRSGEMDKTIIQTKDEAENGRVVDQDVEAGPEAVDIERIERVYK